MGLDPAKVDRLLTRVQREVDEGLSPAVQVAIGYEGESVRSGRRMPSVS